MYDLALALDPGTLTSALEKAHQPAKPPRKPLQQLQSDAGVVLERDEDAHAQGDEGVSCIVRVDQWQMHLDATLRPPAGADNQGHVLLLLRKRAREREANFMRITIDQSTTSTRHPAGMTSK
jgi:hypothetical protein